MSLISLLAYSFIFYKKKFKEVNKYDKINSEVFDKLLEQKIVLLLKKY